MDALTERVDQQGVKLDTLTDRVDTLTERVDQQGAKLDALTNEVELLGRETRRRFENLEELVAELPEKVVEAVDRSSHARLSAVEADVEALKRRIG